MVSNSEGSFAGLATYVLVRWAIMVALLLNMSYLTMVAMHGKAATWVGPSDSPSPLLPLCVEMGFYADISWESRCNIEINVWAHFYKILLVFEVPYWPRVKGMPGKS